MHPNEPITLTRDVEGAVVPVGTKVTLQKGEQAYITQSLGGSYTIIVNGNMFRVAEKDADALGFEVADRPASLTGQRRTREALEQDVWNQLKTCYDPEIPVNIVDLGLVYDCELTPIAENSSYRAGVITLTAPGCGMGPTLAQDVQNIRPSLPGQRCARFKGISASELSVRNNELWHVATWRNCDGRRTAKRVEQAGAFYDHVGRPLQLGSQELHLAAAVRPRLLRHRDDRYHHGALRSRPLRS